jgi:beta-glucosidase
VRRIFFFIVVGIIVFPGGAQDIKMDSFISGIMQKLTVEEKIGQLNLLSTGGFVTGSAINDNVRKKIVTGQIGAVLNASSPELIRSLQELAVSQSRNHIPILFGMDVIHGFRTIFPIPLAMSCTWEPERIERMARMAANEATSRGICWTYSPMVDISRDPRWGRIAEGAGEDPYLGSVLAAAYVRGYQGKNLAADTTMMSCVKHFALYGAAEAGRDYNTVDMSRITMYNGYFPPYKAGIDEGAGSIMTSFNVVDAIPATGNRWLLTKVLRDEWGFKGFVVTDYTAINEMIMHGLGDLQTVSAIALKAGTDMDMVGEGFLTTLRKSLNEGKISEDDIDRACRRVLEAKYRLGLFDDPYRYLSKERAAREIMSPAKIKASLEMAERSMVLLKNRNQVLPLKKSGTIAVIGPLANNRGDMLGTWAMSTDTSRVPTIIEGIMNAGGKSVNVVYAKGCEFTDDPMLSELTYGPVNPNYREGARDKRPAAALLQEALAAARKAGIIVAVLGEAVIWSGEAASRSDIGLPSVQQNLLRELVKTGKPLVLVLINGRPLTLVWEDQNVDAILEAWAPGSEAGDAVANVLFGNYNPSGRLTTTFPRSVGQIPIYYNHKNTGRPFDPANKYTSKYIDISNEPLYPFGYGLSYTSFSWGEIRLSKNRLKGEERLTASINIKNSGNYPGEEVIQLYLNDPAASVSRPVKELKKFRKINLQPGQSMEVEMEISVKDLMFYNSDLEYSWEPGEFDILMGPNSRDLKSSKIIWER